MKKYTFYLCIIIALVLLSGCASARIHCCRRAEISSEQYMTVLPFIDGNFILTPCDFDEDRRAFLVFSEESEHRFSRGTHWFVYVVASISPTHVTEFLDMMNGFSPVLINSATADWRTDDYPFRGLTSDNSLYTLSFFNIPNRVFTHELEGYTAFSIRMAVFETGECGLLYFRLLGRRAHPTYSVTFSDLGYSSLYRITLDELSEFVEFAESLERFRSEHHGHENSLIRLLRLLGVPEGLYFHVIFGVPIIVFIGIVVTIVLIVRRYRKKKASASTTQEEKDFLT